MQLIHYQCPTKINSKHSNIHQHNQQTNKIAHPSNVMEFLFSMDLEKSIQYCFVFLMGVAKTNNTLEYNIGLNDMCQC